MPEEDTANQTPQGGAADETANQNAEGSAQQSGTETPGAGENEGLKAAVVAEQRRRQEAEDRARQAEDNLRLVQQQIALSQQSQEPQADPEEYIQRGTMEQEMDRRVAQVVQAMQQQTFQSQHPDYTEVLGSGTGRDFRPSETLKEVIKSNPSLAGLEQMVANGNPSALSVAYSLANQHKELQELRAAKTASQDRAKNNDMNAKTSPMSPAAAGGGGATTLTTQMPDFRSDEFDAFYESVIEGANMEG